MCHMIPTITLGHRALSAVAFFPGRDFAALLLKGSSVSVCGVCVSVCVFHTYHTQALSSAILLFSLGLQGDCG